MNPHNRWSWHANNTPASKHTVNRQSNFPSLDPNLVVVVVVVPRDSALHTPETVKKAKGRCFM